MASKDALEKDSLLSPFQFLTVSALSAPLLFVNSHNLMQVFTAAVPPHHCRSNHTLDQSHMPNDSCTRYISSLSNESEPCKQGDWEYDLSAFTSIISEWDLVCEREWMKELSQSVYMAGVLVGAVVYGALADRFGRRVVILCCLLQIALMGTCAAFSPNFSLYCTFRFLTGMGICGFIINDLSLATEWTPKRYRVTVSTVQGICATFGQIILPGVAYAITDWRWLQLALSLPFFFFFIIIWWVPESFRWLILTKNPEKAHFNLNRVARLNGEKNGSFVTLEMLEAEKNSSSETSKTTPFDLFRTPAMRKMTLMLSLSWFSSSFCFFALAMDIQRFGLNIYLVQVVFGCSDLPLRVLGTILAAYVGRRFCVSILLIVSGILILCSLAIPSDILLLQMSVTVVAKGLIGSSIVCAYLYTAELFPTVLRQTGIGFTNMMMRLGAVISPLVMMTKVYASYLPLVIFGMVPILCGLPILSLPETLNSQLLDTVEEVEARARQATSQIKEKESLHGTRL